MAVHSILDKTSTDEISVLKTNMNPCAMCFHMFMQNCGFFPISKERERERQRQRDRESNRERERELRLTYRHTERNVLLYAM